MQLRQKQMLERKLKILNAAEKLIRESGETDFSVRVLAATAEVSPATPFNLFGSKEGILYELLLRSLAVVTQEGLVFKAAEKHLHPIEATENAVQFFLDDPGFLRPLYRVLLGCNHQEHRKSFMHGTFYYWQNVADAIVTAPGFRGGVAKEGLVVSLMGHFIGLLELWVQQDLDDDSFRNSATLGVMSILYPFAAKKEQAKIMPILTELAEKQIQLQFASNNH